MQMTLVKIVIINVIDVLHIPIVLNVLRIEKLLQIVNAKKQHMMIQIQNLA